MKKYVLLAGIGAAALALSPAYGQEAFSTGPDNGGTDPTTSFTETVDIEIVYDNRIDTTIDTHVDFDKEVGLFGEVELEGKIKVDSAAVAVSDTKQIVEDNWVVEFNEYDYGNSVDVGSVSGQGNVGVNVAAGTFNMQANVATIASTVAEDDDDNGNGIHTTSGGGGGGGGGGGDRDGDGGWAEASTTALQKLLNNSYYGGVYNGVNLEEVGGRGNIGVNVAAGAFNVQENILTLASVTDSKLAEASAAVIQVSLNNGAWLHSTNNQVSLGSVGGQGNIGVNAAAGVGNVQHNSLTVASSIDD